MVNVARVVEAKFRVATPEEVNEAQGGWLWQKTTYPWKWLMSVWGDYITSQPNSLTWTTPLPLACMHKILWYVGYSPDRGFISDIPSYRRGNSHRIQGENEVIRAFFKEHRNGELFQDSNFVRALFGIVQEAFPKANFTKDDFIFTCSPERSKMYRNLILHLLNGRQMKVHSMFMRNEANETLQSWSKELQINLKTETRFYTSQVITKILLGNSANSKDLCSSINFVNQFIMKKICNAVTEEDTRVYKNALKLFESSVNSILDSTTPIPLFDDKTHELSREQKQAMIFSIFFAGQETLSAFLTYALWQLAKDPALQNQLYDDISTQSANSHVEAKLNKINAFFLKCSKEFTPATGVTRIIRNDLCLEYKLEGDDQPKKYIMYRGEQLVARIMDIAANSNFMDNYSDWFFFGAGAHRCPGEILAVNQIKTFIESLVANYSIHTEQTEDIPRNGSFTLELTGDIYVNLTPRLESARAPEEHKM